MQSDVAAQPRTITVAAVQAELRFYTDPLHFNEHMCALVHRAAAADADLIVLPEDLGTGLLALGAPDQVHEAPDMPAAMAVVAGGVAGRGTGIEGGDVPLQTALMLAQAPAVREAYHDTFSRLARETGSHIAAGTALLPHLDESAAAVHNTFFLFGPNGEVLGSADKVHLIPLEAEEGLMLAPGDPAALAPWPTPLGSLGPVICADAWDAELVGGLVEAGAELLLCPSANPEPWSEYVREDRLEGLHARVAELGVPGVECFGVGTMAGLVFEGRSWIIAPDADGDVAVLAQADDAEGETVVVASVELPPHR